MKKDNTSLRVFAAMLVLVMVTCAILSTTLAKYVAGADANDSARAAIFAFTLTVGGEDIMLTDTVNLFNTINDEQVYGSQTNTGLNGDKIIAPGTWGHFDLRFRNLSEVAVKLDWGLQQTITDGDGQEVEIPIIYFATLINADETYSTRYFSDFYTVGSTVYTGDANKHLEDGEDDFDTDNDLIDTETATQTSSETVTGSSAIANAITAGTDPTKLLSVEIDGTIASIREHISIDRINPGDTAERIVTIGWVWPYENAGIAGGMGHNQDQFGLGGDENDSALGSGGVDAAEANGTIYEYNTETDSYDVWGLDTLTVTVDATITQIEKAVVAPTPAPSVDVSDVETLFERINDPAISNQPLNLTEDIIIDPEAIPESIEYDEEYDGDVYVLDLGGKTVGSDTGKSILVRGNAPMKIANGSVDTDIIVNLAYDYYGVEDPVVDDGCLIIEDDVFMLNSTRLYLNTGYLMIKGDAESGSVATVQQVWLPEGFDEFDYDAGDPDDPDDDYYEWYYAGFAGEGPDEWTGHGVWITNNGVIGSMWVGDADSGSGSQIEATDEAGTFFNGNWENFYDGSGTVNGFMLGDEHEFEW